MLVVIPFLSANQEYYAIYALSISFSLYLTYADIGFLSAGQKYAAEQYALNNQEEEVRILGFTAAILILMFLPFTLSMLYFSSNPGLLIAELSEEGKQLASNMFLIIGFLTPFQIILQRLIQSIIIIRIKDYVSLRIDILFNIVKISSVFYFFQNDKYMIVEYYLFSVSITILSAILIAFIIKKGENYDFLSLIKSIRVTSKYYRLTKNLALSSMLGTISWVLFFEIDLILIGNWIGVRGVAVYAVAFAFLKFLRTLWNAVFSPYSQRFNHYHALKELSQLKVLVTNIVDYTLPLCLLVTTVLIISAKHIVLFWVGVDYTSSIPILQVLIFGTVYGFIIQPAKYYMLSTTKYRFLNALAVITTVVFYFSLFIFYPIYGVFGFAISKGIAATVVFIFSVYILNKEISIVSTLKKGIMKLIVPVSFIILFLPRALESMFSQPEKSIFNLSLLFSILAVFIIVLYCYTLMIDPQKRAFMWFYVKNVRERGFRSE
jgi:O-antigen/teichoic acid export membrane protein